jgi:hypothetical protein
MCLPRMDAGIQTSCLRSFPGAVRPTVEDVCRWIAEARRRKPEEKAGKREMETAAESAETIPMSAEPEAPPPLREEPDTIESPGAPEPTFEPRPTFAPPPRVPVIEPEPIEDAKPVKTVKLTPRPAAPAAEAVEPKRLDEQTVEPHAEGRPMELASYVEGVKAIAPRCPNHERIELAVDGMGRIHLLGREDTLREMNVVARWAKDHRELIAMACPDHTFDPAGATVRHIFSDAPLNLADLHGSDLHLHLLTPVVVDGRQGWYAAPLNRPQA